VAGIRVSAVRPGGPVRHEASLTFFDDAEEEETPEMLWGTPWVEVRRSIESWVVALVRKS
jgi:hypothetical protein